MKFTLYSFLLLILFPVSGIAQVFESQQYFDGADTTENSLIIELDTAASNIWQIGPPQKEIFNSATTEPNVIVTDTINYYPVNDSSSFQFELPYEDDFLWGIYAFQWTQKLDMEHSSDGGIIEFSMDTGITWHNAATSPYVYNFYGFEQENLDTLWNGEIGFTGLDSTWKDIWFCLDGSFMSLFEPPLLRFTFTSDSVANVDQGNEGWMMDNFLAHFTIQHTVDETEKSEYLKVHPNPTTGKVNISTIQIDEFHIIENIKVMDSKGRIVEEYETLPTKTFVNLDHLPNGTYFVNVKTNLKTEIFRIILQHD